MHRHRLLGFDAMRLPFRFRGRAVPWSDLPLHHELTMLKAQAAMPLCSCGLQTGKQFRAASAGAPQGCLAQ